MKLFLASLIAAASLFAVASCESTGGYDGVSRFAGYYGPYYGPGSPPREGG
jgi:hypothetical protein